MASGTDNFSAVRTYLAVPKVVRALVLAVLALVSSLAGGITPEAAAGPPADPIDRVLARMTVEEKVGQMFMAHGFGTSARDPDPPMIQANQDLYGVDNFEGLIENYNLGGVIYFNFSNNVDSPRQVAELSNELQDISTTSGAEVPLLVATDQEQGLVVRLNEPATQFPGAMALGATRSTELARTAARITGEEIRAVGINVDFAPDADVNVNPRNPVIGVRSFGSRPGLVSRMAAAQVRGLHDGSAAATPKHFPGHGDTDTDSHTGLPVIDQTLEEIEEIDLPPFRAAVAAGADLVMTAHIVVPALDDSGRPATLSRKILTGVLRRDIGFKGVVVTDALTMEGVRTMFGDGRVPVEAIKAGADMMLMPPDIDAAYLGVLEALESGEITEARLDRSVRRILALKQELGLFAETHVDPDAAGEAVGTPEHRAVADAIARRSVTLLQNDGALPLAAGTPVKIFTTGFGTTTLDKFALEAGLRSIGGVETLETGSAPNEATIAQAVAAAADDDVIVVSTSRAWTFPGQQDLVDAMVETGKPVIVLATRDPYDIAYFPDVSAYLALYGSRPISIEASVRVIFGEIDATGRLPVSIPTEDGSETMFPFGSGL